MLADAWILTSAEPLPPVAAARPASADELRQTYGPALENWTGPGSFKAFLRSLGMPRLVC